MQVEVEFKGLLNPFLRVPTLFGLNWGVKCNKQQDGKKALCFDRMTFTGKELLPQNVCPHLWTCLCSLTAALLVNGKQHRERSLHVLPTHSLHGLKDFNANSFLPIIVTGWATDDAEFVCFDSIRFCYQHTYRRTARARK